MKIFQALRDYICAGCGVKVSGNGMYCPACLNGGGGH